MVKIDYTKDKVNKDLATVGEHSYGVPIIKRYGECNRLYVGKFCSFAENVTILLGGNHYTNFITTYPFANIDKWSEAQGLQYTYSNGDVHIGNDVWVGFGATILSGVTIGDGAVIGAMSLVTKDVPPYTVVGGNPAKEIRKRFSITHIARLMNIKWWDWPEDKIRANVALLNSDSRDKFITMHD